MIPADQNRNITNICVFFFKQKTAYEMTGVQTCALPIWRFVVLLLGGFAAFALILASLGIYGVISYSVSQRTQEIGIRMALGQSSGDLQRGIVGQTMRLAAIGMLVGIPASWILARTLRGLLFGVMSTDPVTFLAMAMVLTMVAASAGYLPARRA